MADKCIDYETVVVQTCKCRRSKIVYNVNEGQVSYCTLPSVRCDAVHYRWSGVLLYITVGQIYCCTLPPVSCITVHYHRSGDLLHITVGQV